MSTIRNNINTYADLTAYNAANKDYPNVSYIQATDEVKYAIETRLVAKYNVASTESETKLLSNTTNISDTIIDGVLQPRVVTSYQFSTTGEHIVKFGLENTTKTGQNKFDNNQNVTSITIPNSVTFIEDNFLHGCRAITTLTIPSGVTSIGHYFLDGCSGLTSVTVLATTPPTLGAMYPFNNTNNCPIYVPAESVDTYKAASGWSSYASRIFAIPTT